MQPVPSAASASAGTLGYANAGTKSLAQVQIIRFVLLSLPTAVVLGPVASYPLFSGGIFTLYRFLYVPAAVVFYIIWHQRGQPRFTGSRALLVFLALAAILGTILIISPSSTFRGATDHFILLSSLLMAWLVAAAVSSDADSRNILLTGWFAAFMVAAALAVLQALGLLTVPTANNILADQYAAAGRVLGSAGTLGNANDLAGFALAAAPIAYLAARRWKRPWLTGLVVGAALAMALVSLSRTAVIGLALIPLAYLALRRSFTPGRLAVLVIVSGYVATLMITLYATPLRSWLKGVPLLGKTLSEADLGLTAGDNDRFSTWVDMLQSSIARIPFGAGPGQFEELTYQLNFALTSNAHNVFLEVAFEYGVLVGAAGLVWIAIVAVSALQRARLAASDADNLVVAAGAASLAGLILWGLLTSTLITRPPWAMLLGTGVGLVSSVALAKRRT